MRARLAILAVLVLAGCGGDDGAGDVPAHACTEIGCAPDAVQVEVQGLANGADVELCVENRKCVRSSGPGMSATLPKGRDRVRVTMIVRTDERVVARATKRFTVKVSRPNGPDCPPVCRQVIARFDTATGRLEEA